MLTMNNINKKYNDHEALKQVNLTIPKGSCFGLVGPNGAGKSTLMKIIASIIPSYDGKILWEEEKIHQQIKRSIGYIPQEICLEQTVSALQNLYLFGKLYGLKGKQLKMRAKEVLSYIGLSARGKDKVLTFSGGMKRRLNIGCALMNDPLLLLMDEPTVGIDPQSRHYIFEMIDKLKQTGCTIIYASHYMEEVERICDEVAFIDQGKIVEQGKVHHLLKTYAIPSIYVQGSNCLPANIETFGRVQKKKAGFVITSKIPLDTMEKVLQFCRENNRLLERLELEQPRLEDIFFSLTGNQLRD